jgi:predicted RNA-binding Zn ribbon-like protein
MDTTQPPEPQHDAAATDDLVLLREFVNTTDIEDQVDEIDTPEKLSAWLADPAHFGRAVPVSDSTLRRAIAIREGLRALGRANNGEPLDHDRLDALNRAAAELPVAIGVQPDGWKLTPATSGGDTFLAHVMASVVRAMADGSWATVKACRSDTCQFLFIDESRNHSGTWCSMRVCGSRAKARAYRARQRTPATA